MELFKPSRTGFQTFDTYCGPSLATHYFLGPPLLHCLGPWWLYAQITPEACADFLTHICSRAGKRKLGKYDRYMMHRLSAKERKTPTAGMRRDSTPLEVPAWAAGRPQCHSSKQWLREYLGWKRDLMLKVKFEVSLRPTGNETAGQTRGTQDKGSRDSTAADLLCGRLESVLAAYILEGKMGTMLSATLGPSWVTCILHFCSWYIYLSWVFYILDTMILNPLLFCIKKSWILISNMGKLEPPTLPRWINHTHHELSFERVFQFTPTICFMIGFRLVPSGNTP